MSHLDAHIVDLGTDPSIKTVAELRDRLTAAITENERVVISAEGAAGIDLSVLQLLASAHRTASTAGKSLSLAAPATGALQQALAKAGFLGPAGEPLTREGTFWIPSPAPKDQAA
ncbi:MAG TPA: STAS domain-containing protein [Devosia sp.]